MAYTRDQIEKLLNDVATTINISDELFDKANEEYTSLGQWIDKKTEEDGTGYSVLIYPQGSFALGTVIKPISDTDDYDLDLVCELDRDYGLSAEQLKLEVVKSWLTSYRKQKQEIEEKKRCWHVEYENVPNFHMDVIPAHDAGTTASTFIHITNKNAEHSYSYIGSNPKGYIQWFFRQCKKKPRSTAENSRMIVFDMAEQERLDKNKYKTKLQKAVQILKRHRDVMFEHNQDNAPISIIITTLAAQIYDGEDTLLGIISDFANGVEAYLEKTKRDGRYAIPNPSYTGEDFADKWKTHPERQQAFFDWIEQLKTDFDLRQLEELDRVSMGLKIKNVFGAMTGSTVFALAGLVEAQAVQSQSLKVDKQTGNLSRTGTVSVPASHHYGKI